MHAVPVPVHEPCWQKRPISTPDAKYAVRLPEHTGSWGQVLTMILREAVTLGVLGIVVGGTAAALLVRYIASFLYDLTPFDPVSAGSAMLLMLVVAVGSGWWPARFASRLDPMQALRHE